MCGHFSLTNKPSAEVLYVCSHVNNANEKTIMNINLTTIQHKINTLINNLLMKILL